MGVGGRAAPSGEDALKKLSILAVSGSLLLGIGGGVAPASAHHTFSIFDMSRIETGQGIVKDFQWANPHSWIDVEVTDQAGTVQLIGLEGYSPNMLRRKGWRKDTLKPGEMISFTYFPMRGGKSGGGFRTVILANGKVMESYDFPAAPGSGAAAGK